MPRFRSSSHLYLVVRRVTTLSVTMPAVSSFSPRVASLCPLRSEVAALRSLAVCGVKATHVPHLDVLARCSSSDPAASSSWDLFSEHTPASQLSTRFRKGLTFPFDCTIATGAPYSRAAPGACTGSFSSLCRGASGRDGINVGKLNNAASVGDEQAVEGSVSTEFENVEEGEAVSGKPSQEADDATLRSGDSRSPDIESGTKEESLSKKARGAYLDKRRRAVGDPNRPLPVWRDLLTVPGIGCRNMEKLVAKGIAKLDELKQLYRDKYRSDGTEKMVEFLRSSVGVQKHHATSISVFIKESVDAEEGGTVDNGVPSRKRLTFCVEGNISVGKTTFLRRIANETVELRDLVEVVPEPVGKWQDVGPDHFNILDAFYGDPERYAYTFQNYVFVTRMMQERESAKGDKRLRLMERSVFSDRMVFVRAVHEAKWMSDAEISIYDSWFDPVVSAMPGLVPDAFIYLRATPDTCLRRLQSRNREEETNVTLDYLRGLHEKHEQWLFPAEHTGSGVLSVSDWASGHKGPLSSRLQDRVLYLQGDNVHSYIQKVPALVLDCEPSIDFSKDVEAKAEYARQVAEFFDYVQHMKDTQPEARDSTSLILPRAGGLLGPDGNLLQPNTLEGDLRRQISTLCA